MKKVSKTKLKIVQTDMKTGQSIKAYEKTKLSNKLYYWNIYKPLMIKTFKKIKTETRERNYGATNPTNSNREIWMHTYGKGSSKNPASWTSPNGFVFKDNAWAIAYYVDYSFAFYDSSGKKISDFYGTMYASSSDYAIKIPDNAVKMKIGIKYGGILIYAGKSFELDANSGAMAFDGIMLRDYRNFHLKTTNFDSGYISLPITDVVNPFVFI